LAPSPTYSYRVIASNTGGDSTPSAVVAATTNPLAPPAPEDVGASPVSASSITVSWIDQTGESSDTTYRVQRSTDGLTGWQDAGTIDAGVKTFSDEIGRAHV